MGSMGDCRVVVGVRGVWLASAAVLEMDLGGSICVGFCSGSGSIGCILLFTFCLISCLVFSSISPTLVVVLLFHLYAPLIER